MKRAIWSVGLAILWATAAPAQTKSKTEQTNKKAAAAVQVVPPVQVPQGVHNLTTWGQYNAKRGLSSSNSAFTISDPTVRTLHLRAQGAPVPPDGKDILGVPKIVYGLSNGQIIFRTRGATTSGTGTGSGAVGTGSSTGPLGMHGFVPGVNGKSHNAGPIMDGMIVTDIQESRPVPQRKNRQATLRRRQ